MSDHELPSWARDPDATLARREAEDAALETYASGCSWVLGVVVTVLSIAGVVGGLYVLFF